MCKKESVSILLSYNEHANENEKKITQIRRKIENVSEHSDAYMY